MSEPYKLKDFFSPELVKKISEDIASVWPSFQKAEFQQKIIPELKNLELKERADKICWIMYEYLPNDYHKAIDILLKSFPPEIQGEQLEGMSSFYYMPHSNYVANYGLNHFDVSMKAMYEITKRFTSEFSIRPFIQKYPTKTLAKLHEWIDDPNPHVRRLVSEGTRPRLPWASRLPEFQKDPTSVILLLEKLKEDPALYVRRSVANNLNDIAKDNSGRVIEILERWNQSKNQGTQWIVRHAARSLIKQGNPRVLKLLGFNPDVKIELLNLTIASKTPIGEDTNFEFEIISKERKQVDILIDYIIYFKKSNGSNSPKVFKLSKKKIKPKERLNFKKKHSFKNRTTRKHYPGLHFIEVMINGKKYGKTEFNLV